MTYYIPNETPEQQRTRYAKERETFISKLVDLQLAIMAKQGRAVFGVEMKIVDAEGGEHRGDLVVVGLEAPTNGHRGALTSLGHVDHAGLGGRVPDPVHPAAGADRRPAVEDEFVGQEHFLGPGKLLRRLLAARLTGRASGAKSPPSPAAPQGR